MARERSGPGAGAAGRPRASRWADRAGGRERVGEVHRGGDAGRGVRAEPAGRFGAGPVVPDQGERARRRRRPHRGPGCPAALVVFPARRHDAPAVHLPGAEPGPVG